jgi:hypothetical protein
LTERRDRAHHQARVQVAERPRTDADAVELAGSEALDQHVRLARESAQPIHVGGHTQIESQAALPRVAGEPLDAVIGLRLAADEWTLPARRVTAWRFDLDHLGAEIGQDTPGEVALLVGEIEDA